MASATVVGAVCCPAAASAVSWRFQRSSSLVGSKLPHGAVGTAKLIVMRVPETSRNHDRKPGYEFRDGLDLPGWEDQSIWGYDEGIGSFFAQLWRNGSRSDDPEVWLSGVTKNYPWPGCVALDIVEITKQDPVAVTRALAIAVAKPRLRSDVEIRDRVEHLSATSGDAYVDGQRHALLWALGQADVCPGSRWGWTGGVPSAEQVDAERDLVTGRIYRRGENQSLCSGADEALMWALNRMDEVFP
jgi:hypothetical protein